MADQDVNQRQFPIAPTADDNYQFPIPPTYNGDTEISGNTLLEESDNEIDTDSPGVNHALNKYLDKNNAHEIFARFKVFNNTDWQTQFNDFVEWFVHPHTPFPNNNEVQIILQDSDSENLHFGDVIQNGEPTGENIVEAFNIIAERTDLRLMPISKFMGNTITSFESFITQHNLENASTFGCNTEEVTDFLFCKYMRSNFNLYYRNQGIVEDGLIFFDIQPLKQLLKKLKI